MICIECRAGFHVVCIELGHNMDPANCDCRHVKRHAYDNPSQRGEINELRPNLPAQANAW